MKAFLESPNPIPCPESLSQFFKAPAKKNLPVGKLVLKSKDNCSLCKEVCSVIDLQSFNSLNSFQVYMAQKSASTMTKNHSETDKFLTEQIEEGKASFVSNVTICKKCINRLFEEEKTFIVQLEILRSKIKTEPIKDVDPSSLFCVEPIEKVRNGANHNDRDLFTTKGNNQESASYFASFQNSQPQMNFNQMPFANVSSATVPMSANEEAREVNMLIVEYNKMQSKHNTSVASYVADLSEMLNRNGATTNLELDDRYKINDKAKSLINDLKFQLEMIQSFSNQHKSLITQIQKLINEQACLENGPYFDMAEMKVEEPKPTNMPNRKSQPNGLVRGEMHQVDPANKKEVKDMIKNRVQNQPYGHNPHQNGMPPLQNMFDSSRQGDSQTKKNMPSVNMPPEMIMALQNQSMRTSNLGYGFFFKQNDATSHDVPPNVRNEPKYLPRTSRNSRSS